MPIDPITYSAVRDHAGLYDATRAYGRLFARGKDAIDLLHRMSTNDMKPLETGKGLATQTFLTNEKGRIVDLLTVVKDEAGEVMLVTSAGGEEVVIQWMDKFTIMEDAQFIKATNTISQYEIVGPRASSIVRGFGVDAMDGVDVVGIPIAGYPSTIWRESDSRYCIFCLTEYASSVWKVLTEEVRSAGGSIIDDELFEVLRVESGIAKAPNELNEKHNPLETSLAASAVSFTKGCYIGQEVIARLDAQGKVQRQLVGLKFGDGVPKIGDRISIEGLANVSPLGDEIGEVTSIANSPTKGNIGLGYVRAKYANPGQIVSVKDSEGIKLSATLVTLPFDV